MIKLKPEHVGTRVLLSDGRIALVRYHGTFEGDEWWEVDDSAYNINGNPFHDPDLPPTITLFLDAPNPLDVPVPEWCGMITLWRGSGKRHRLRPAGFLLEQDWDEWLTRPHGWSPAPGQTPSKNNEEFN